MAFPALLDTCVLYPAYLCDTLLRLAEVETFRPLWSPDIMLELERNLVESAGCEERAVRHRLDQMNGAFVDANVKGYTGLIDAMRCDEKDRHVLAAAVRANAEVLVTYNLRHFPASTVEPFDLKVVHPDDFLLDQIDLYPGPTRTALEAQARARRNPPHTVDDVLDGLERCQVPDFARAARAMFRDE